MDYYQILGIERSASEEDIRKAYRRLAMKHHPDRGGDVSEFQKIQEAYDTLSDPARRSQYDNPQPQMGPGGFGFGAGFPPGFEDFFSGFQNMGPFANIFNQRSAQRNRTLNIQTSISLEDAFRGKELVANIKLPSGREQLVEIKIPQGIQDGNTLRLSGMGDDTHQNLPRGDLHLTIHVENHPRFFRDGDDLIHTLEIDCVHAILGTQVQITTLDDKILNVQIPAGAQHSQILSLPGYGMPKLSDSRFRGRLLLNLKIKIPTTITDRQKQLLEQFLE